MNGWYKEGRNEQREKGRKRNEGMKGAWKDEETKVGGLSLAIDISISISI